VSYTLRTGLCVGFASLLPVLTDWDATAAALFQLPLFAPVFVAVAMGPKHVGVVLNNGTTILCGWLFGACLTCAALTAAHASSGLWTARALDSVTYVVLVVLCLLVLYPEYSPLAQKMAADCIIISVFAIQTPVPLSQVALFPWHLVLSVVAGMLPCLAFNVLLPWPGARACEEASPLVDDLMHTTSELIALFCQSLGDNASGRGEARASQARAASLRASAAASMTALRTLVSPCEWEAFVGLAPRRHFMHWLTHRLTFLRDVLQHVDGIHMALQAIKAAETQHARAVHRARMHRLSNAMRLGEHTQSPAPDVADSGALPRDSLVGDFDRIDEWMSTHMTRLASACRAVLEGMDRDDHDGSDAAVQALDSAWTTAFHELDIARSAIYYADEPPSFVEASLTSYGPPVEHYAMFMSFQQLFSIIQTAVHQSKLPPPSMSWTVHDVLKAVWLWMLRFARSGVAPFTQRPPLARVVYVVTLVGAVVIAAWFGVLTSGSGTWAAIACQIVGARSSVHVGGSFRTASARLMGTLIGSMFAYTALALLRQSAHNHPGTLMVLLGVWSTLLAVPRTSPRHAYAALVASFVPYIIVLGTSSAATTGTTAINRRDLAYTRIEQNILGIVVFVLVEVLVWPQRASRQLPRALSDTLRASAMCLSAAWAPMITIRPRCTVCAAAHTHASAHAKVTLSQRMAHLEALTAEASEEPSWMATTTQRGLLALASVMQAHLARLGTVLALMQEAAEKLSLDEGATLESSRITGPLRAASDALHTALCHLLASLARDLEAARNYSSTNAAAAGVDAALEAFEPVFVAQMVSLRTDFLGSNRCDPKPPPLGLLMALDAVLFHTRESAAIVDVLVGAEQEFLKEATSTIDVEAGAGDEFEAKLLVKGVQEEPAAPEKGEHSTSRCQCGAQIGV